MKSKIYILPVIGILIFSAADVNAQVKGGSFSITPLAGYSKFAERSVYEDTETYGIAIGYNFSERFSLEATYNILDTEIVPAGKTISGDSGGGLPLPPGAPVAEPELVTPGGAEVDAYQWALEMIFYIYPGKKFAPYGAVGIGMTEFEYIYRDSNKSFSDHNLPLGFGFKYFMTDTIALRADLHGVFPFDQNNLRATVGVTFRLDGE